MEDKMVRTEHTAANASDASASELRALIGDIESAAQGSRDLDRAIGFSQGVGTDLERSVYRELGGSAFIPDVHGLTPMDYKNGDFVRPEWVKGTRGKPGGYRPRVWLNCNGKRPLRGCPAYSTSLDAAVSLIETALPGWAWSVGNMSTGGQGYVMRRGEGLIGGSAATPALALCAAFLKALSDGPQGQAPADDDATRPQGAKGQ